MPPGGIKGAERFRDSTLLVETVKQFHCSGRIVAAICAAPATVLVPHDILPIGNMTGFPTPKTKFPPNNGWTSASSGTHGKIATSRGPGTAIDFGLKDHPPLVGGEKADESGITTGDGGRDLESLRVVSDAQMSHLLDAT
ncbi:DJ-1/PfpI family protein [Shigella flexneri]